MMLCKFCNTSLLLCIQRMQFGSLLSAINKVHANIALQSSHGVCRLSARCAAGMAFVAQFFVCRVVVANYYWSLMISAVAALDTKPVKPLSCHHGENGNMKVYHVGLISCLLQSGAACQQSGTENCCCQYVSVSAVCASVCPPCRDNATIALHADMVLLLMSHGTASSEMQYVWWAGMH